MSGLVGADVDGCVSYPLHCPYCGSEDLRKFESVSFTQTTSINDETLHSQQHPNEWCFDVDRIWCENCQKEFPSVDFLEAVQEAKPAPRGLQCPNCKDTGDPCDLILQISSEDRSTIEWYQCANPDCMAWYNEAGELEEICPTGESH